MRCLRDEFQSALHDKFICQKVENVHDLFIPVLLRVISTSRNNGDGRRMVDSLENPARL